MKMTVRNQVWLWAIIFLMTSNLFASSVYITTSQNILQVDLVTGQTDLVASISQYVSDGPRGIAYDENGTIYIGTDQIGTSGWTKRVLKVTPQINGPAIVEPFTDPITSRYGTGQIGFNSKGDLFVAGDTDQVIYHYDTNGNLINTLGFDGNALNNVGLLVDNDIIYSIGYFSPYKIVRYDTSSDVISGGVIDSLTFNEFYPASIAKGHDGNLIIGGGRSGTQLWDYNPSNGELNMLFDCSPWGISTFAQYDSYDNRYIIPSLTSLTLVSPNGQYINTITSPYLTNIRAISEPFIVPEPCSISLLAFGGLLWYRKRKLR